MPTRPVLPFYLFSMMYFKMYWNYEAKKISKPNDTRACNMPIGPVLPVNHI